MNETTATDTKEPQTLEPMRSLLTEGERKLLRKISVPCNPRYPREPWKVVGHKAPPHLQTMADRGYVRFSKVVDIWGETGELGIAITEAGRTIISAIDGRLIL